VKRIEVAIDSQIDNRMKTRPVKIQERNQNVVLTWNVYSEGKINLEQIFHEFIEIINRETKEVKGETIQLELEKGNIYDSSVQEFAILSGQTWDVYLYDPEIFIYIRVLLESRLNETKERWISIDVDIIKHSAWFVD
jgi:hypothetical protein